MPRSPGDAARLNLRCTSCGYGVRVRIAPSRCPMCGGTSWEHVVDDALVRLLQARLRGAAGERGLSRSLNEEIVRLTESEPADAEVDLVCECPDPRCLAAVRVTAADYAAVVAAPAHYLVAAGHEGGDHVVYAGDGYAVVEASGEAEAAGAGEAEGRAPGEEPPAGSASNTVSQARPAPGRERGGVPNGR